MTKSKERPSVMLEQLGAHCDYLEKTLIPDLKETMPETARDRLNNKQSHQKSVGQDKSPIHGSPSRYR